MFELHGPEGQGPVTDIRLAGLLLRLAGLLLRLAGLLPFCMVHPWMVGIINVN